MSKTLGIKLRRAREGLDLTQEELAKAVGLSSKFISQLEIGKRGPSLESLRALAGFLKKDVSYFLKDDESGFSILLRREFLDRKIISEIKKFQKYYQDYLYIEEHTNRHLELAPLYTNISAERLADEERRRLGLGSEPIHDIFCLLEINGLRIWRHSFPDASKVIGIFVYLQAEKAAFSMINNTYSLGNQIMTAAHQYAHFLKDRNGEPIVDNPDILIDEYLPLYHPRERFAQTFAIRFLIPPAKLKEIIEKDIRSTKITIENVLYLKRYFGVNLQAILQALKELGYLSPARLKEYQRLDPETHEEAIFENTKGIEKHKKDKRRTVTSDRFKILAFEAYRKKKIHEEKLANLLKRDKSKIILKISRK